MTHEPWRPTPAPASRTGQGATDARDERRGNWFTRGGWWFLVHVLSVGVLSPVPFVHAALRSRRVVHGALAVAVVVLVVGGLSLLGSAPKDAAGSGTGPVADVANTLLLLNLVGGLVALVVVRQQIFGAHARPAVDPAVATALAARQRREEARRLAADDPMLAREIRVGRPDLARTYDDGGLVELNTAPPATIAQVCGIPPEHAGRIVQARQAAGRFSSVEDVFAFADLPVDVWDMVRDRGVVVR